MVTTQRLVTNRNCRYHQLLCLKTSIIMQPITLIVGILLLSVGTTTIDAFQIFPESSVLARALVDGPKLLNSLSGQKTLILPPKRSPRLDRSTSSTGFILLPGCMATPEKYRDLAERIQSDIAKNGGQNQVWIAIPPFPMNIPNPHTLASAIDDAVERLREAGFRGSNYFLGGHSLGGAFLPAHYRQIEKTRDHKLKGKIKGVVCIGSFDPRGDDQRSTSSIPTLTVSGELDGLVRASRIAEAYHTLIIQKGDDDTAKLNNPVVLIEGMVG